jgi:hypothetical protein
MIHNRGLFLFLLVRMIRPCVHIIKLPNSSSKMAILKFIISPLSESESFTIPFYRYLPNSIRGCIQTAVTIAAVTENICMNRR